MADDSELARASELLTRTNLHYAAFMMRMLRALKEKPASASDLQYEVVCSARTIEATLNSAVGYGLIVGTVAHVSVCNTIYTVYGLTDFGRTVTELAEMLIAVTRA